MPQTVKNQGRLKYFPIKKSGNLRQSRENRKKVSLVREMQICSPGVLHTFLIPFFSIFHFLGRGSIFIPKISIVDFFQRIVNFLLTKVMENDIWLRKSQGIFLLQEWDSPIFFMIAALLHIYIYMSLKHQQFSDEESILFGALYSSFGGFFS